MKYARKIQDKDAAMKEFEHLNSLVNIVLGATNTTAGKILYDAKNVLSENKKIWRHEIKHDMKAACKAYDDYEHLHIQNFGDRYQLFLDYLDSVEDEIQPHIDRLRIAIKQALDKYNEPDSDIKSYVETARVIVEYSCKIYDMLLKKAKEKSGIDFNNLMRPARLTATLNNIDKVATRVCKLNNVTDIDLNNDDNCRLAFRVIENKLTSEDFINRTGYEAITLNPESRKYVSDEDFNELEEKYGH